MSNSIAEEYYRKYMKTITNDYHLSQLNGDEYDNLMADIDEYVEHCDKYIGKYFLDKLVATKEAYTNVRDEELLYTRTQSNESLLIRMSQLHRYRDYARIMIEDECKRRGLRLPHLQECTPVTRVRSWFKFWE